ncbi:MULTISPECIES: MarR family winged helix-turn-helix transcriptional regulator [Vibrio]|uniref:MarR family winged helix-turn-helix transcriptional regulator n=1 Tax=Vibrio TaxID=662 RepID=UPI0011B7C7CF|nr:MarR family transcriptional regulator [Vibrio splendidus]MCF7485396.1 MarR family transcriptional regulator [Vibrio sp. A2-1]NOI90894.1 MarR family transcriptional regulator [Vibrio splendidus]NOJ02971.1 MarR family transcriptional regulator [Vibrio splendidus]
MSPRKDPISRQVSILYRQELSIVSHLLEQHDISFSQLPFVMELYTAQGVSQEVLVSKVQVDKAMATRVLKQLVDKGMITRKRNPNDARSKLVYPTEKALELKPKLIKIIGDWNDILSAGISEEELEIVKRVNRQMINNVKETFAK